MSIQQLQPATVVTASQLFESETPPAVSASEPVHATR
jgi:hypothetical protein